MPRLSREQIAARVAQDIPDGSYVNLGIGVPTLVADFLPEDRQIVLHTENGLLGMGGAAREDEIDEDLINAGKVFVTETPGAAYFHHADSFAMMRGEHLDFCVLGAYQISASGDLANWKTNSPTIIPGVGGAMDLAVGARQVFVVMNLLTREGESKVVAECSYPLTGKNCIDRAYTDIALFEFSGDKPRVLEIYDDIDFDELVDLVGIELEDARSSRAS